MADPWERCPRCGDNHTRYRVRRFDWMDIIFWSVAGIVFPPIWIYVIYMFIQVRKEHDFNCEVCKFEWKKGEGATN